MSARGARSRKAVAKDIEKKEKKTAAKQYAESIPRAPTGLSDWGSLGFRKDSQNPSPTNQIINRTTSQAATSSTTSLPQSRGSSQATNVPRRPSQQGTNYSHPTAEPRLFYRPTTSAGASTNSTSSGKDKAKHQGNDKAKYQAKGKETKAPRGRGGGVPIKKPTDTPQIPSRTESVTSYAYSTEKSWTDFRIWYGNDHGIRPYRGFVFDEDMQTGSVLVFFKDEQDNDYQSMPQLRVRLEALENCGSTWLNNALRYGKMDLFEDEMTPPMSLESNSITAHHPSFRSNSSQFGEGMNLPHRSHQEYDDGNFGPPLRSSSRSGFNPTGGRLMLQSLAGPPSTGFGAESYQETPSIYENEEIPATHELWFAAPAHVRSPQGQRLHHVAIRNFLAILQNKPIVGRDLFEMLSTLQPEVEIMYDLDHNEYSQMSSRMRSVQIITQYLANRKLDDVRNSVRRALGLLAWAEQDAVRWQEGYLEAFVHLVGMMSPQIEESEDFRRLSAVSRRNLGISAKALQLKLIEAEEKLSTFDFTEMWDSPEDAGANPIYKSFVAFRQFLISFYTSAYGSWPPSSGGRWLNSKLVKNLQNDFGSLYDYLVNRDVIWDSREERPGKKWQMADMSPSPKDFMPDTPTLPLTDMLVSFDNRHGLLHIPHPYPLLPRSIQAQKAPQKKSLFSALKKSKNDPSKDAKAHLQLSIVFSDATNIQKLGVSFTGNALIDHFERYELNADLKEVSPRAARLGRWILLYGILQVLSQLSVDTGGLKYKDGVQYFLCADLKRCPPWETNIERPLAEASQFGSWCWQRPWDDTTRRQSQMPASELEGSGKVRSELDGRGLERDISRIGEKIAGLGWAREGEQRMSEQRRSEFDVLKGFEFEEEKRFERMEEFVAQRGGGGGGGGGGGEGDYEKPRVPARSPLRTPSRAQGSRMGYFDEGAVI